MRRLAAVLVVVVGLLAFDGGEADAALPTGFASVVTQRNLVQPTSLALAPDGRLFVAEQRGTIQAYDSVDDESPSLFADLRRIVHSHWDRGLLSVEVDPAWPTRPYVYAMFSYDAPVGQTAPFWGGTSDSDPCPWGSHFDPKGCPAQTRVARLTADARPAMTVLDYLITDVCRQFPFHDGGGLRFAADGSLYAALGEGAWPGSPDYGQLGGNPCRDPLNEGGSLRSQDVRTTNDPLGLSGTLLRLDPNGVAPPAMLAYGLRNPFRIAPRSNGEVWIGDVGALSVEELNVVAPGDPVKNFGWPCYEGPKRQASYDGLDLPLCESLYTQGSATPPTDYYCHAGTAPACQAGGGAISGVTFSATGDLYFADYTRQAIYVKRLLPTGDLGPIETWATEVGGPVDLRTGPNGDLFYVDVFTGQVVRIYVGVAGVPPVEEPTPTASIDQPTATTKAVIGKELPFSGSATDETGQPLPPSALRWTLVVLHCPTEDSCHRHFVESREGVASGSFTVPDHDGVWRLEIVLRATGATASDQTSVVLDKQPTTK
jgi:glucose/arabinose dehydrogenase